MQFRERTDAEWKEYWTQYWNKARSLAGGRWDAILRTLAPSLTDALNQEGKRHVPCPVHGGTDGFRVFKNYHESGRAICNTCGHFHDGFSVLEWANGWTRRQTVEAVMAFLTGDSSHRFTEPVQRQLPPKKVAKPTRSNDEKRESLNKTMQRVVPMSHPSAEPLRLYLARRGLAPLKSPSVMFHPRLAYSDGDRITGFHPAMVAVVQSATGDPVTLHRTYLDEDGRKADVAEAKKLMAYSDDLKILGGAIRLMKPGKVLGVAEGIETAYAASEGMGIPVWATVNATMMEHFVPPDEVELIVVFSDKDRPSEQHPKGHGQEASRALVGRMWAMNKKAMAITPKGEIPEGQKSLDWLDVLNRDGAKGFPSFEAVRRAMLEQVFGKAA
nr:primase-helicase zinc-binding domain-containing protein [uncultured Comamonas sp.]